MKIKKLFTAAAIFLAVAPAAHSQSLMDQCRAYARAVEAVATARDNLDQPSWDELVKLHPSLNKNGKNDRAVLYASLISLRIINKAASPRALMLNAFESCPTTFACMHLGEGCPK